MYPVVAQKSIMYCTTFSYSSRMAEGGYSSRDVGISEAVLDISTSKQVICITHAFT